jgi:hypothetical protein
MGVVLDFLGVGVRQSGKPPHRNSHCQILALHETRGDVLRVRISGDALFLAADALSRAVLLRRSGIVSLENSFQHEIYASVGERQLKENA